MANILLISINDFNAEGLRILSAVLKNNQHQAHIGFIKSYDIGKKAEEYDWTGIDNTGREFRYARGSAISDTEKTILLSLIRDIGPGIIGISVTTPLRKTAAEVSMLIKGSFKTPVIWGGVDPTINPRECLSYCDFVCIGEGERSIVDIASLLDQNRDIRQVNNLAYLAGSELIKNRLYPLIPDLASLPFKDIDSNGKFLIEDNSLLKDFNIASYTNNHSYHIMSARGCPYRCAYCCEDFYKELYDNQVFLRRRTPVHVVNELKKAKEILGYKHVIFQDEVFSCDYEWLREFSAMYKKQVSSEFACNIYPNKDIEKYVKVLKETGLIFACLGLQSGSQAINSKVFNRVFDRQLFIKTANLLHSAGIGYYVDVITFNPFEQEKDLQSTLSVLKELPKPFSLCVNKLYACKGTRIHGLLQGYKRSRGEKPLREGVFIYYSCLFWLAVNHSKALVGLIDNMRIFKYLVSLLHRFRKIRSRCLSIQGH